MGIDLLGYQGAERREKCGVFPQLRLCPAPELLNREEGFAMTQRIRIGSRTFSKSPLSTVDGCAAPPLADDSGRYKGRGTESAGEL